MDDRDVFDAYTNADITVKISNIEVTLSQFEYPTGAGKEHVAVLTPTDALKSTLNTKVTPDAYIKVTRSGYTYNKQI